MTLPGVTRLITQSGSRSSASSTTSKRSSRSSNVVVVKRQTVPRVQAAAADPPTRTASGTRRGNRAADSSTSTRLGSVFLPRAKPRSECDPTASARRHKPTRPPSSRGGSTQAVYRTRDNGPSQAQRALPASSTEHSRWQRRRYRDVETMGEHLARVGAVGNKATPSATSPASATTSRAKAARSARSPRPPSAPCPAPRTPPTSPTWAWVAERRAEGADRTRSARGWAPRSVRKAQADLEPPKTTGSPSRRPPARTTCRGTSVRLCGPPRGANARQQGHRALGR